MKKPRRIAVLASLSLTALALAFVPSATAVLAGSDFEGDDGNLVVDTGGNVDWNSFSPTTWTGTAPTRVSTKDAAGWSFKGFEDSQATTSDSAFAGGTKQDDICPKVITAKAPNKDDLKRIYLASKTGSNGHTYLSLAWVRIPQNTTSPSAHVAFEFNKGTDGTCSATNPLPKRLAGDMLVVYDFEGGTDTPVITISRWVTSGACEVGSHTAPCWGPQDELDAGEAEARVNTGGSVSDAIGPDGTEDLGTKEFGEAAIDLTAAGVFNPGECETFGTASAVSRTSGSSSTAQMKDLVGPGEFQLTNCGSVKIIKRTDPRGQNQAFPFTSTLAGAQLSCVQDATPASFTLNDNGNTNSDSAANTENCVNVPAGSYTVAEGADPAGYSFVSLTCTNSGGNSSSTSDKTASITVAGGGSTVCVYVNKLNQGAILVTKTRKHAASGSGDHPHAGVDFTVNGVTKTTDANGQACFDGLTFGSYTVHETVPAGYAGEDDKSVTVDNSAKCSDNPYVGETVSFSNTPLTDITVTVDSQVDGGTASTIVCKDSGDNTVGSGTTGANGDGSASADDLEPDTYTCTVVVDP